MGLMQVSGFRGCWVTVNPEPYKVSGSLAGWIGG